MYRLKKNNIERLVLSKDAADNLIEKGFALLPQKEEAKKSNGDTQSTKKSSKKE